MDKVCSNCGSQLDEGARFCLRCGTPVETQQKSDLKYCVQCGNVLKPGLRFCEVCGREIAHEKPKEEPAAEEPATMDEIVIPVINDETFGGAGRVGNMPQSYDGFEAAVMPDSAPSKPAAPQPKPEFAMDTAYAEQPKPKAAVTVKPVAATPKPAPQRNVDTYAAATQNFYQNATAQAPSPNQAPPPAPRNNGYNPGAPIPTYDADGNEKKDSFVVPIILASLIVIVLIIDAIVFLGHKDEKDDKDDAKKNVSVITVIETETDADIFTY